ncbi:MAG: enoyl-CoA hydratase/isomerase family protein [Alphaproteobacteria bacterium]|jgi:enoyl-CoA hydratase|nr:enoyl-CoA hydratase/isomerase family protein [Alphaproteobacteria bacterium]
MAGQFETLLAERDEHTAILTMNRPQALNACNVGLWRDLRQAFEALRKDNEIRAVILTGAGRAFSVGADLKETAWKNETAAQSHARIESHQQDLARLILSIPVPVIAAINGYALGGGLETALACDLRLAASTARLGFPESRVGSFITGGASILLPRLVGLSMAKNMLFTGRHVPAGEARTIGLVDEVLPEADLKSRAIELCRDIGRSAPLSVRAMKATLNRAILGDMEAALANETLTLLSLYGTADHREGSVAFGERREPVFRGQ